jgi:hypothetical protein
VLRLQKAAGNRAVVQTLKLATYCECVTDEVLASNGRNVARLRAMEAELGRLRPGAPPSRLLVDASRACASA